MAKGPLISYTDKLYDIFDDIDDKISKKLIELEGDPIVENEYEIEMVDKSNQDWSFDVKIKGRWKPMKVGVFLRQFLGGDITEAEIKDFTEKYNELKRGGVSLGSVAPKKPVVQWKKVEVPAFSWNPKDVRSTFLSLTTQTYPHGHEEEVVPYIKNAGLQKDQFGNYYKIIGQSETMFTSHLDTADRKKAPKVTVYSKIENGEEILTSDGTTILGADDKSGVAVMLYMISHNVPGIYYFFIGEERGGIGSNKVASVFETIEHLKNVKRCVSFDRRSYYSVITEQLTMECCSDEFAQALASQYNTKGMTFKLDDTGIYTDSASFIDQIPECTNISVGYFDEHTFKESQNITFLEKLAKASVNVDWEKLPTARKIGIDEEILLYFGDFIQDLKLAPFNVEVKIVNQRGSTFVRLIMDEVDYELVKDDIFSLAVLLDNYDMDPTITFEDDMMFLELVSRRKKYSKFLDSFQTFEARNEGEEYDDDWNDSKYRPSDGDEYDDFYDDEEDWSDDGASGEVNELAYWIRQLFKTNKINCSVESESNYGLTTYVFLSKKEKISNLLKVFEVVNQVKNELLTQYDVEFELYENKHGEPIFKFNFTWSSEVDDSDDVEGEDGVPWV
jgi:hypothetical protein